MVEGQLEVCPARRCRNRETLALHPEELTSQACPYPMLRDREALALHPGGVTWGRLPYFKVEGQLGVCSATSWRAEDRGNNLLVLDKTNCQE